MAFNSSPLQLVDASGVGSGGDDDDDDDDDDDKEGATIPS